MAYAAYRDHRVLAPRTLAGSCKVLEVVVPSVDAFRVRRGISRCPGAGVLRCEPIVHARPTCESAAARVRLSIRLPLESYPAVLHCLLECAPDGEIGHLADWREHLAQHGFAHGG